MSGSFKSIFKSQKAEVLEPPVKEKPLMRILEPRVLLDAAAVETALDVAGQAVHKQFADEFAENSENSAQMTDGAESEVDDQATYSEDKEDENISSARRSDREIVFIDAGVEDKDGLISSLEPGVTVHILDAKLDGVQQIADILSESGGFDALHIFSHGESGALQLGNTILDANSISGKHADALREIGNALGEDGDILIYGCDFGKGEAGQLAAQKFAAATGADVAASDDLTGSESLAGDWDLEVQVGEVERQAFSLPKFSGILEGIELGAVGEPVVGHFGGGEIGTPGTFATWENAATFDPNDGSGVQTYDVRAIIVGTSENTSASFETAQSGDGSLDDFRVVVTNLNATSTTIAGQNVLEEGSVSVIWEVRDSITGSPAPSNIINIVLSDLDGLAGTPETQDSIRIRTDELASTTIETGTTLVDSYEDGFLSYSGTAQVNGTSNAQVGATWANSNQFTIVYSTYTQTQSFDLDGDGGKTFTNPTVIPTQSIDLNGPETAGNDFAALYVNNADSTSDEDVPTALVDVDMELFDLDSSTLQSATITLTNAQVGDELRFDPALLSVLGIQGTLIDTRTTDGRLTLQLDTVSGNATVSNFETAIKATRFANDNSDGALNAGVVRLIEFEVTDGFITTTGVTTTVQIASAGLAPVAGANVYVTDEDTMIMVDAATGLISDDKSPTGASLFVVEGTDSSGNTIPVGIATPLPSGGVITINSDGSFTYVPQENFSGNEAISYLVGGVDPVSGNTFTNQSWVSIDVQPIIDTVTIDIDQPNPSSEEDDATEIFGVSASSEDAGEVQQVFAEQIPAGVILTDGTNSFTADPIFNFVDITDWDRTNLRVLPIQNSDIDIEIMIVVNNFEVDGSFSSSGQSVTFEIDAVADTPLLQVEFAVGSIDQPVALDQIIMPQLFDADSSEQLTDIIISNIPAGGSFLISGVVQPEIGGLVTVQAIDLINLTFQPPITGTSEIYEMLVTATSEEVNAENGIAGLSATTDPVELRVILNDSDDPVIAFNDTATTFTGETTEIDVLDNDFVPDGDPSVLEVNGIPIDFITEITLPGGEGTVRLNVNGNLEYTASTNFAGDVSFEYTLRDRDGSTDIGLVTVSVEPRWTIAAGPIAVEGGDARFNVTLEGVVNQGDTVTVDIAIQPGTADFSDFGNLTTAINDSIINLSQDGFSFDGTTLTYTAPPSDFGTVYTPADGGFVDISSSGTALNLGNDGVSTQPIGFVFPFFGNSYSTAYISANGYITFDNPINAPVNEQLDGSALSGQSVIAPFWDDLGLDSGDVFTEIVGTAPDRQMIIQWHDVTNETDASGTGNFQVVLSEADGSIKFYYDDVEFNGNGDFGAGASIGIQGASGSFEEFSFNAPNSVLSGSSISYTPGIIVGPNLLIDVPIVDDPDFEQSENFELILSNSTGAAIGTDFAVATIDVSDNQAPTAVDDVLTTDEISNTSINVLTNAAGADSDPEGFSISLTAIDGTAVGTDTPVSLASGAVVTASTDGSIIYDPNNSFSALAVGEQGMDSFTYEVTDVFGESSLATVHITIDGVNQSIQFDLDDGGVTPVQAYSAVYQPTDSEISVVSPNAVVFDVDSTTAATFEVGLSGFVDPVDEIIRFGGAAFVFGTSQTTTVAFGSGPTTTIEVIYDGSSLLTFTNDAGGDIPIEHIQLLIRDMTYEHASSDDTPGSRVFSFRADDGFGNGIDTLSDIFVRGNNLDPTAVDDGVIDPFETAEETTISIPVATLITNDFDADGDAFDVLSVNGGMNGVATLDVSGNVNFTPTTDFVGLTSFTYTLLDARGGTGTAEVFVNVTPINDAPVVDLNGIGAGSDHTISYTENDPSISIFDEFGFVGDVDDADLESASVTITGAQVDDIISLGTMPAGITAEILPVSAQTGLTGPATVTIQFSGTASVADYNAAVRSVSYENTSDDPIEGDRTAVVVANDGELDSAVATTVITLTAVNDAPILSDDTSFTLNEDSSIILSQASLLFNDNDLEGDTLNIVSVQDAMNGSVLLNASNEIVFTPDADYFGPASFTYTVDDGNGGVSIALVSLTVTSVNDLTIIDLNNTTSGFDHSDIYIENGLGTPIADSTIAFADVDDSQLDSATIVLTNGQIGDLLEVGILPAGITASIVPVAALTSTGTVVVTLSGTASFADYQSALNVVTYRSNSDAPSIIARDIEVTVNDGDDESAPVNSVITVIAVNDTPIAFDDNPPAFDEDTILTIPTADLLANDIDPDGDVLTIVSVQTAINGTVGFDLSGNIEFIPLADYFGPASFTYTVEDPDGEQSTATVNLMVSSVNDQTIIDLDATSVGSEYSATYTENAIGTTIIGPDVEFTDVDDMNIESATLTLTNGQVGDLISVAGIPSSILGVTVDVSPSSPLTVPSTITVTFSGSATLGEYEALVQLATFSSVSDDPSTVSREIQVQLNDGDSISDAVISTITVTAVNDAPTATPDGPFSFDEDTDFTIAPAAVLFNDSDPENDSLTIVSVQDGINGTVVINGAGDIQFTPDVDYFGPASFTYTVDDGNGEQSTATVSLTVSSVNDRTQVDLDTTTAGNAYNTGYTEGGVGVAIAGPDVELLDVDDTLVESVSVILTNGFVDDLLEVGTLPSGIAATVSPAGALVINGPITVTLTGSASLADYQAAIGAVTYRSQSGNINDVDRILTVTANDGDSVSNVATSTIAITAVNDAPIANPDGPFVFDEDTGFSITSTALLFNDNDPENDTLTITSVQDAMNGTVVINGAGSIEFTPDVDYFGPASFTYTVEDGNGGSNIALVDLTVSAVNDRPTLDLNGVATGTGYVANFTEGDGLVAVIDAGVAITDVDDTEIENATVVLTNGQIGDVLSVGTLPAGITATVSPATALVISGAVQIDLVGSASLADWQAALAAISYTNASDNPDTTTRSITVRVNDGDDSSPIRLSQVTVTAVNDAPTASPDGPFSFDEDTDFTIAASGLLFNDADAELDPLSITSVQDAMNGSVTMDGAGLITFVPDAHYNGPASFTYTVEDGNGGATTAVVDLDVISINDVPDVDLDGSSAGLDFATSYVENGAGIRIVNTDVSIVDADHIDLNGATIVLTNGRAGDILEVGVLPGTMSASVVPGLGLDNDGQITIALSGVASLADYQTALQAITFRSTSEFPNIDTRLIEVVVDDGSDQSLTANTTIAVTSVNDLPEANDDGAVTAIVVQEDESLTFDPVLSNDVDLDGDVLTITAIDGANLLPGGSASLANGSIELDANGTTLTFTPSPNFFGAVTFNYTITDGTAFDTATVSLNVVSVNDAPNVLDDGPVVLVEDTDVFFDPVTPNDTDVEGDPLNIVAIDGQTIAIGGTVTTANGQVTLGGDGRTLRFVPSENFFGNAPIVYTVSDGQDTSDATVTFDVTPVDDVVTLIGTPPDVTVDDGSVVNIPLASFFDDPDDDPVLYSATGLPSGLSINASTGVISGMMDSSASQNGPYVVTLTASDGLTSTISTDFTINAVNTIPVASGNIDVPLGEGDAFVFDAGGLFSDADADVLVFAESGLPSWASFDQLTGVITGTVPIDASIFGPVVVTVSADDVDGGTASTLVTLLPQNIAPVIVGNALDVSLGENEPLTFDVTTHFADGENDMDVLSFSVTGLPAGLSFDSTTGIITGTTATGSGQTMPYNVVLTADDGQGGTISDTLLISVISDEPFFEEPTDTVDPDGEPTTVDEPIDVVGEIEDEETVKADEDLNGTVALDQDSGVLLSAVGGISTLSQITRSGSVDASSIELFSSDSFESATQFSAPVVDGSSYNPPLQDNVGFDQFIEEKELRERANFDPRLDKFFLDVLNRHDVAFFEFKHTMDPLRDGTIVRTVITLPDGSPLPEWMKLVREGFISAKLPSEDTTVELKITIMLGSGNELSKTVIVTVTNQQASVEADGVIIEKQVAEVGQSARSIDQEKAPPEPVGAEISE